MGGGPAPFQTIGLPYRGADWNVDYDPPIDDESSHPKLCSEVAGGVTRNLVRLFRAPDAGNPPVRFDERVVSRRREIVLLYER
jgi:hypothetical protein